MLSVNTHELLAYRQALARAEKRLQRKVRSSLNESKEAHRLDQLLNEDVTFLVKEVQSEDCDWVMEVGAIINHLQTSLDPSLSLQRALERSRRTYMIRQEDEFLSHGAYSQAHTALLGVLYHELGLILRAINDDEHVDLRSIWILSFVIKTGEEWTAMTNRLRAINVHGLVR